MSLNTIYEFYQTMEREDAMISFKGDITADLLNSVLLIIESKLVALEKSTKTRKKVYNVLVECLQNLYHHNYGIDALREEKRSDIVLPNSSILIISNPKNHYEIKTGNFVSIQKAKEIEKKLEKINNLDKPQLREFYKTVLNEGKISCKGTAGLGLIDIARKSGNKLEYSFLSINENYSFFCLNVKIN